MSKSAYSVTTEINVSEKLEFALNSIIYRFNVDKDFVTNELLPSLLVAAKYCNDEESLINCIDGVVKLFNFRYWSIGDIPSKIIELASVSYGVDVDSYTNISFPEVKDLEDSLLNKQMEIIWRSEVSDRWILRSKETCVYPGISMSHGLEYSTPEATALYFDGKGRKASLHGSLSQMMKGAGLMGFFDHHPNIYYDKGDSLGVIAECVAKEIIENGVKLSRPKDWKPSLKSNSTNDIFYHFAEYLMGDSVYGHTKGDIIRFIEKGGLRIKNLLHTPNVKHYIKSFDAGILMSENASLRNISSKDMETLVSYISKKPHVASKISKLLSTDTKSSVPEVTIKSGKMTMRPVKKNDPLNLFIGNHTACCQKLTGYGESVALVGFNDENSLNYVFEKDGKIWAHVWIILCKDGSLIMDSIEGNTGPYQSDINDCVVKFADKYKYDVLISSTNYGMTKEVVRNIKTTGVQTPKMKTSYRYTDSNERSYRIIKTEELRDTYVPKDQRTKFGNKLADVLYTAGL